MHELASRGLSERAACRGSGVSRRIARYQANQPDRDQGLAERIQNAAREHPEFGYRQVAGYISESAERVRRLWAKLGLKRRAARKSRQKRIPNPNPRPERAEYPNHVWTYDMMHDKLYDRSPYRLLNVLDEFTRECMVIHASRSIKSTDVVQVLWEVMQATGRKPKYIRSDNGSEFAADAVTEWLAAQQVGPTFIEVGSPWQNGYIESFNGKVRVELLKREWFQSLAEARIMIENWRRFYNDSRPHSALGRMPPSKFAATWIAA